MSIMFADEAVGGDMEQFVGGEPLALDFLLHGYNIAQRVYGVRV
jgi:hypothetical protein